MQGLGFGNRKHVRIDHSVIFRERRRVPEATVPIERMRSHAESAVRGAGPVLQIVPAFIARLRPVGDLIMDITGRSQPFAGELIKTDELLFRGNSRRLPGPGTSFLEL